MARKKQFELALDDLWSYYKRKMMEPIVGRPRGRRSRLSPHKRKEKIERIKWLAEEVLKNDEGIWKEFSKSCREWRWMKLKGRTEKKIEKARKKVGRRKKFIYAFRNRNDIYTYVGRTTIGYRRFLQPDEYERFREARKLDILRPWEKGDIYRLECMAMHFLLPRDNIQKASRRRYGRKCPICRQIEKVEEELNKTFKRS